MPDDLSPPGVRPGDRPTRFALGGGVAIPLLDDRVQALAAPFFPGFRLTGTTASEPGSDRSPFAAAYDAGIMLQGVVGLVAAFGFARGLRPIGVRSGLGARGPERRDDRPPGPPGQAFPHARPTPRRASGVRRGDARAAPAVARRVMAGRRPGLRADLAANLLLLAAMAPVMSGLAGIDTQAVRGLLQRVITLAVFPPIGVAAFAVGRRLRARPA